MIIGRENFHFELKIEVFAHREQTGTVVSASAQIESGIEIVRFYENFIHVTYIKIAHIFFWAISGGNVRLSSSNLLSFSLFAFHFRYLAHRLT